MMSSEKGIWFSGELDFERGRLQVLYDPFHEYQGAELVVYDADWKELDRSLIAMPRYYKTRVLGELNLDTVDLGFLPGVEVIYSYLSGLARYMVRLLASGVGKNTAQVVEVCFAGSKSMIMEGVWQDRGSDWRLSGLGPYSVKKKGDGFVVALAGVGEEPVEFWELISYADWSVV